MPKKGLCWSLLSLACSILLRALGGNALDANFFDWDIEPISFEQNNGIKAPITFTYRIPSLDDRKTCEVKLLDYECQPITDDPSNSNAIFFLNPPDSTSLDQRLTVDLVMDINEIEGSDFYSFLDAYRGLVSFCLRVDCNLDGESINFHETKWRLTIDFVAGFTISGEALSPYSRYKKLHSYMLTFYQTDGDLSEGALFALEAATSLFLSAELSAWFNDPVRVYASILSQEMVQKQMPSRLLGSMQSFNNRGRILQEEEETGSTLEIELEAEFSSEPAPNTDEVNEAQQTIWDEGADQFLGNITAVVEICQSEIAFLAETEFETAKDVVLEVNETLVNTTVNQALRNMTHEELIFAEAAVKVCNNLTDELNNITEVCCADPIAGTGERDSVTLSISLGTGVYAYFCDDSNDPTPDPILRQGDTVTFCVLREDSTHYHLEDILTVAFTQPSTGIETQYAVNQMEASMLSRKRCSGGICNIKAQVAARFFEPGAGPIRIVGVAVNAFGPPDQRSLLRSFTSFSSGRNLEEDSMNPFQLYVELATPTHTNIFEELEGEASPGPWISIVLGAVGAFVMALICCCIFGCWHYFNNHIQHRQSGSSGDSICSTPQSQPVPELDESAISMRAGLGELAKRLEARNNRARKPTGKECDKSVETAETYESSVTNLTITFVD